MEITCLLNPGVFKYQGKTWLLLRVAERPVQQKGIISFLFMMKKEKLRLCRLRKMIPTGCSDRGLSANQGKITLTTMSYLRLVSSTDGIHFQDEPTIRLSLEKVNWKHSELKIAE